ncbi:class I SAM-dependent methyltransferase [Arthrobacter sp. FX8]|nr:class I SAM-dependent methyltransferase [Arthrobacter sp. FX8]WAJ34840.1 class I SAM-dependent methyltransferase [Arthrobacter sp. FX8]
METGAAERTGNGSTGHAARLEKALGVVLGTGQIPLRLRAWDGSEAGPVDAPVLEFRSRKALRRILWSPGQLGLSRAYVAGEIDTPGDIFAAFTALSSAGKFAEPGPFRPLTAGELWRLLRTAVRLGAIGPNPAPPPEEARIAKKGRMHSRRRDSAAISHHYDVGNDFYALVLGPSLVYSCAVWATPAAPKPPGVALTRGWTPLRRPSWTWSAASWGFNRGCGCWMWAAAGAASPSTLRPGTASA